MAFVGVKTNRKVMIEAQLPRVSPEKPSDNGGEKGVVAEVRFPLSGGAAAGLAENIRQTVTEMWSAVMMMHRPYVFSHDCFMTEFFIFRRKLF